jgi:hypothetical protein
MTPRKPQPALLGMAADMQLARQELFNPKQFSQLQRQIEYAKAMERFTMESEVQTIDLRPRMKSPPIDPPKPAVQKRATPRKACPNCAGLFHNLGMHLHTCKSAPRQIEAGELCEYGCGRPALHLTVKGKACCMPSAKNCAAVNAARVANRARRTRIMTCAADSAILTK